MASSPVPAADPPAPAPNPPAPAPPESTPVEPTPVEPPPVEPTPVESTPVEPTPVEPTPVESTPVEPPQVEPTPVEPTPVEPTPVEPVPLESTPVEPTPAEPPQVEYTPVEPGISPPNDKGLDKMENLTPTSSPSRSTTGAVNWGAYFGATRKYSAVAAVEPPAPITKKKKKKKVTSDRGNGEIGTSDHGNGGDTSDRSNGEMGPSDLIELIISRLKAENLMTANLNANKPLLSGEDAPWPGSTYIISEKDTPAVITFRDNKVVLAEYNPGQSNQRWVCHARNGWLGFTNDPGESTVYMGHDANAKLHSDAPQHLTEQMFCVRKRPEGGFQMLMRNGDGLLPVGKDTDGDLARIGDWDANNWWWGFTKV